ncbi:MAG: formate dehydrogenase family accessory protein FdhD [Mycobacterium sp.]|jgi:FdhD protein|nr:formate dehydrogenase family accessory protein FdhD [Mycobacterium sp.]
MGRVTTRKPVLRIDLAAGSTDRRPDTLVVEEPLEIRVGGDSLAVTMRTPGHDMELAAGFLVSEGVIWATEHIRAQRYCAGATVDNVNTYNLLDVDLAPGVAAPTDAVRRSVFTSSSCGVCGKASLDAVRTTAMFDLRADATVVDAAVIATLPDRLREEQAVFDRTGGLHAAGLFTAAGELLVLREDVGRHNAVDKVVGWALQNGRLPLTGTVLQVSGRASFELVQKAWMAGIPVLSAVSAPSSLAVELAAEAGMGLLGFVRGPRMNVYAGTERVRVPVPA